MELFKLKICLSQTRLSCLRCLLDLESFPISTVTSIGGEGRVKRRKRTRTNTSQPERQRVTLYLRPEPRSWGYLTWKPLDFPAGGGGVSFCLYNQCESEIRHSIALTQVLVTPATKILKHEQFILYELAKQTKTVPISKEHSWGLLSNGYLRSCALQCPSLTCEPWPVLSFVSLCISLYNLVSSKTSTKLV